MIVEVTSYDLDVFFFCGWFSCLESIGFGMERDLVQMWAGFVLYN